MKHLLKIVVIDLILIAGFSSCTYGTFEGTGGGGNLIITNIPAAYKSTQDETYTIEIGGNSTYKFSPAPKITGSKVSAPLYNDTTVYTASGPVLLTFVIHKNGIEEARMSNKIVNFFDGSGLVEWKTDTTP
jgi:hypothetical protein